MSEFETYKTGVIDCLTFLCNHRNTASARRDFLIGIHNLDKPEKLVEECNWLEKLLEKYVNCRSIKVSSLSFPDTISIEPSSINVLENPSDVIDFVTSLKYEYDGIMDYFDFFAYCTSIIDQLNYIGNKKLTPKIANHTYIILNGVDYMNENRYICEMKWLKKICTTYLEDSKVVINRDAIPKGIESCSYIGASISNKKQMIDFIKSIHLVDSYDSVESNSNCYNDENWEMLIDSIDNSIKVGEYSQAETLLDDYYNKYKPRKDYYYYYWKIIICIYWLESYELAVSDSQRVATRIKYYIRNATDLADSTQTKDIKELTNRLNSYLNKPNKKKFWHKSIQDFNNAIDKEDYYLAQGTLEDCYNKFGDERDYFYYSNVFPCLLKIYENGPSPYYANLLNLMIEPFRASCSTEEELKYFYYYHKTALDKGIIKNKTSSTCQESNVSEIKEIEKKETPEELYKKEVLLMLQDGEIGEKERLFLERKRKTFGLTEKQAKEIEDSCIFKDKDNVNNVFEYSDIYSELVNNGKPTERIRKILDREAERLGLTQEQKITIENLFKNNVQ